MPQLLANRAAVRAAQFAIAAAGILFLLLVFSRQAHAAAPDEHPGLNSATTSTASAVTGPASAGTSAAGNPLTSAVGSVTGAANAVTGSADKAVTGAAAAVDQASAPGKPAQPATQAEPT